MGLPSDRLKSHPLCVLNAEVGERLPEIRTDVSNLLLDPDIFGSEVEMQSKGGRRELVVIDGSCTELRRLHSELTLQEYSDCEVFFEMLYPQADHVTNPLQLIRDTVYQYQGLSGIHLLLRVEAGERIFGRELVSAESLLGGENQLGHWQGALCKQAVIICYEQITDYAPAQQVIPSELVHPLRLPPVLMAVEQEALVFSGNDTAVQVTESVLTLSPQSGTIAAATIRISDGFVAGEDELVYLPDSPATVAGDMITGNFDSERGILELAGVASSKAYGEALKQVYFINNSCTPADHLREIEITVSDSGVVSNVMTRPVTVYPVDNLPALDTLSNPAHKNTFSDSIKALDCSVCSDAGAVVDVVFTIIEPAYGFDVLKNGKPVFEFFRSDIEAGSISLFQDCPEVSSGTIYLEVDDGSDAAFGVVVSVGEFGATPDHGLDNIAGPEAPFTAEPHDLRPPPGGAAGRDADDDRQFGT